MFLLNYKKGCIRLAAASDKVYQLLAHGQWFSPGTLTSSTTKAGRHDIAEILLNPFSFLNWDIGKFNYFFLCTLLICFTKSVNNRKTVKTVMTLTWYRHF
jgi:hypothetical protein